MSALDVGSLRAKWTARAPSKLNACVAVAEARLRGDAALVCYTLDMAQRRWEAPGAAPMNRAAFVSRCCSAWQGRRASDGFAFFKRVLEESGWGLRTVCVGSPRAYPYSPDAVWCRVRDHDWKDARRIARQCVMQAGADLALFDVLAGQELLRILEIC